MLPFDEASTIWVLQEEPVQLLYFKKKWFVAFPLVMYAICGLPTALRWYLHATFHFS